MIRFIAEEEKITLQGGESLRWVCLEMGHPQIHWFITIQSSFSFIFWIKSVIFRGFSGIFFYIFLRSQVRPLVDISKFVFFGRE
jgi:hypothetical protein